MSTKDALRERAQRLMAFGVAQKILAARMGMSPSAFSRWMNDDNVRVSTDALDGFNAYVRELRAALGGEQETERAVPAAAGEGFPESRGSGGSVGIATRVPEQRKARS